MTDGPWHEMPDLDAEEAWELMQRGYCVKATHVGGLTWLVTDGLAYNEAYPSLGYGKDRDYWVGWARKHRFVIVGHPSAVTQDAETPRPPVGDRGGVETSATLMAGFGLVASVVQMFGYVQTAGLLYACVQTYVLCRYVKRRGAP